MTASRIQLATDGPHFSRIVVGLMKLARWDFALNERIEWVEACLDMGITTFDHADIYGSYTCEQLFGEVLAEVPSLRQKMQLVTKCGIMLLSENRPHNWIKHYNTSKKHILASVENSLRMLQTDCIDLLLIHRPDPLMDADEIAEAFKILRKGGKVLHFGVSNFTPSQYQLLASRLDVPLVTNQVEFSPLNMSVLEDGTLELCQKLRISPMAWSPVGGGRIFQPDDEQTWRINQAVTEVSEELGGVSLDKVLIAWILMHPAKILPVLGTHRLDRIQNAIDAEQLPLNRQQWFKIWSAAMGQDVP